MKKKIILILIVVLILSLISTYIDIIFFSKYLYQNNHLYLDQRYFLFFIRSFVEFVLFGLGVILGLTISFIKKSR